MPTYVLAAAGAAAAGIATTIWMARRQGMPVGRLALFELCLAGIALIGAKAFSAFETGSLGGTLLLTGGLRYPGGLLAACAAAPFVRRLVGLETTFAALADVMAPGIAVAMGVVRIGCLSEGCCYGTTTSLPWATTFPPRSPAWNTHLFAGWIPETSPASLPVHPLQVYFLVWAFTVAIVLIYLSARSRRHGEVAATFLMLHEAGKMALESLRGVPVAPLFQASLVLALVGAASLLLLRLAPVRDAAAVRP